MPKKIQKYFGGNRVTNVKLKKNNYAGSIFMMRRHLRQLSWCALNAGESCCNFPHEQVNDSQPLDLR
jgi:hypothetical protein